MEVPNVESLLDYVFTDEDFSDTPSEKEYKKLCRVMKVAILWTFSNFLHFLLDFHAPVFNMMVAAFLTLT